MRDRSVFYLWNPLMWKEAFLKALPETLIALGVFAVIWTLISYWLIWGL